MINGSLKYDDDDRVDGSRARQFELFMSSQVKLLIYIYTLTGL